mmetsp:Transcript_11089/g.36411  ORF Transcript_11089/g.36411 Transcript_11089/m.36411 type:complete len:607 (-) Transcript_11089:388-2208(-)
MQNIILAFAGRVLLRKADVRFERGHRYGLIGQNGTGKTTLLNRLAAKDINGFPQELRTWYIRHEVLCDDGIDVRTFLKDKSPAKLAGGGDVDDAFVEATLDQVQFPEEYRAAFVNSLSGGWKMRMSVAISIMHEPELLLLDEPTNHLDRESIEWLTKHLLSLTGVTMGIVSHDYDFIDEVCTDVTHYDNGGQLGKPCRFVYYPMTFRQFQQLRPEIAAGLPASGKATGAADDGTGYVDPRTGRLIPWGDGAEPSDEGGSESGTGSALSTLSNVEQLVASGSILPIRFPDPGKPEGIRTYRKPVMTMKDIHFTYEGSERAIITSASVTVTLGSRVVMLGANGAGKTTLLKLLIGDLEPTEGVGEVWKHHNLRLAYIAQHSLHHLEEYLQQTPIAYIQERFRQGLDVELSKLKTLALTDDEKAIRDQTGAVKDVVGRQKRGKQVWYEVVKPGRKGEATQWYPLEEIETQFKPYVLKMVKNYDLKVQALESGLAVRPITSAEILEHLDDFGLGSDLAHGKIKQLSGGQRQRLVICAAFWSKPHLIALDEPTNYLDNDTLAALTQALKGFKGAVVTVSENEAFVNEISNEKWVVEEAAVTLVQLRDAKAR